MNTTGSLMTENRSSDAMIMRRQVDIVWTTTPLQPLQQTYSSAQLLQIILQKSRHFIPVGEIEIAFRPVVQYSSDSGNFPDLARKLMLCLTLPCASEAICFQNATAEGNTLVSQSNFSLQRTRNLPQNYFNMMENVKKKDKMKPEHYMDGLIAGGNSGGSNLRGLSEIAQTHPGVSALTNNVSYYDNDPYARALIDTSIQYNDQFNCQQSGQPTRPSNVYYAPQISVEGDSVLTSPMVQGQYPLLGLCITPSVAIYKAQQSRFAHFRQRFISYQTTVFNDPTGTIQAEAYRVTQTGLGPNAPLQLKFVYGQPINGILGANGTSGGMNYTSSVLAGSNPVRATGQVPTAGNCSFAPKEQYTNVSCKIKETAIEFDTRMNGIDLVCMDNTQLVLQYNVNNVESCLSAYIQPSYFNPQGVTNPLPAGYFQNNAAFLRSCLMPTGMRLVLTDVVLRIPYYTYTDESAYALCRQACYAPQNYYSLRIQTDPINLGASGGQIFSRLSIGGSSLINSVLIFITPGQLATSPIATATSPTSSDCSVNYFGINVPQNGDARCVWGFDSYYVTMQDVYVQVNNRRYAVNAIPISDQALATYLVTQAGLETCFGKFLNIPLNHYLANRFMYAVAINPNGDRNAIITDNQLIVSATINFTSRLENSAYYGESNKDPANRFQLTTVAVTQQAFCENSYVKIA